MTLERDEALWVLRLDGDCLMTVAAELQALLLEWLASARDLCVDLGGAGQIDITILQLLWAAHRAAARDNRGFVSRVPDKFAALAREAGFEGFPGEAVDQHEAETVGVPVPVEG